jgi:hypothetical protein
MDSNFKKFADFRLSREQMKNVKGGRKCEVSYTTSGGNEAVATINCYWMSMNTCIAEIKDAYPSSYSYDCAIV